MENFKFRLAELSARIRVFKNAMFFKFDNRRVIIIKQKDNWVMIFKNFSTDPAPRALTEHIRGKIAHTAIRLTQESAEAVMIGLAEQMGLDIVIRHTGTKE